jgi:hypothetical protein
MNYKQIREGIWRWAGFPTADGRQDNLLQEMREAINHTHSHVFLKTPFWWFNIQKWTVPIVAGTSYYTVSDWLRLPTRIWVEGDSAGPLEFISPEECDRQGLRSTSMVQAASSLTNYTMKEMRRTPLYTCVGNTVVGNTTFTRTSGDAIVAGMVGTRVRVNGEPVDYKVLSINTNTVVVDKGYQPILYQSEGLTAAGSNTTAGTFEFSPGPVWQLEIMPVPSESETLYVWGNARERYLTDDTDVPEIPEGWQEVITIGTKLRMCDAFRRPAEEKAQLAGLFEHMINSMKKVDMPVGGAKRLYYQTPFAVQSTMRRNLGRPNDVFPWGGR